MLVTLYCLYPSFTVQRPGFASGPQPEQELDDLLRLCADPPLLELLSSPDAMDVTNANVSLQDRVGGRGVGVAAGHIRDHCHKIKGKYSMIKEATWAI